MSAQSVGQQGLQRRVRFLRYYREEFRRIAASVEPNVVGVGDGSQRSYSGQQAAYIKGRALKAAEARMEESEAVEYGDLPIGARFKIDPELDHFWTKCDKHTAKHSTGPDSFMRKKDLVHRIDGGEDQS